MNRAILTPYRLLLAAVVAGLAAVALRPDVLATLGVAYHREWFLDSYAILAANDAVRAGLDVSAANPLDALNRPHVYSDWWLGLRWLGLTREQNFLFGGFCGAVFLGAVAAAFRPRTYRAAAFLAALLLAPPGLIAIQRANNDLLIFALLGAGMLGWSRGGSPRRLAVFVGTVVLATGLKYYPVVALGAVAVVLPWRKPVVALLLAALLTSALVLASQGSALGRGMFELPRTIYQFGAAVLWRDLALGRATLATLSAAIFGLGAILAVRKRWTTGLADPQRGGDGERLMFAVGACLLLGCFLAGTSYFYRWIFGLWLWPWLWREAVAGQTAARVALALWLAAVWADGLLCLVVNPLGLAYRPELGWRILTQPFTWALLALLAGWLWEGFVAQARAWHARSRG